MMKSYCVYILTNRTGTLYVGITSDLPKRLHEHRSGAYDGFVSRYHLDRLIYYEAFDRVEEAIAREKQIKRWRREKKIRLVAEQNPEWRDLTAEVMW
jgi:putative endonuclease